MTSSSYKTSNSAYSISGDVGHIEKEENIENTEDSTKIKRLDEDPHHILKHISQTQPVTTI